MVSVGSSSLLLVLISTHVWLSSNENIENLTAKPFWASESLDWAAELEENAHIIQEEFEAKLLNDELFSADSVWQNQVMGEGKSFLLSVHFCCFCLQHFANKMQNYSFQ